MAARTSLIAAAAVAGALLGIRPAHAECPPGSTDVGVGCVGKPVITGPAYGNLPGAWQITPIAGDGRAFYHTNTITGRVELCLPVVPSTGFN